MNIIEKAKDAFSVFKVGKVVADPAKWKSHQVSANQVIAVLAGALGLAKACGYDLHMDDSTVNSLGVGLFALVNWVFTVATTDKIGIFGQRANVPDPEVAGSPGNRVEAGFAQPAPSVGSEPAVTAAPSAVRPELRGPQSDDDGMRAGG